MRPPLPDPDHLSAEQQIVYDAIINGPRGRLDPPLAVWLNSPDLAQHAQALGAYCRYGTSLKPHLSELAILVIAAHWKAGFEWTVHAPIALAAGLDPALVEALRVGKTPPLSNPEEHCVHAFATELLAAQHVSDATYAEACTVLGTVAAVELVGILGYYSLISMTIVAFHIPTPDGLDPFA